MRIDCTGSAQITVPRLAQITVTDEGMTIDLASPSIRVRQAEGRLIIELHPRLAYVAPEERSGVAAEIGLKPYEYLRQA